jgi:hypothetical protein
MAPEIKPADAPDGTTAEMKMENRFQSFFSLLAE